MSNESTWKTVTFDELQAGDRVQVKIEHADSIGLWTRTTIDRGEFVLGHIVTDGWSVQNHPVEVAVMSPLSIRANIKQTVLRYVPPFEFPLELGTIFSGMHYDDGRHIFVVADYFSESDPAIYRNVTDPGWHDKKGLLSKYSDFKLGEA